MAGDKSDNIEIQLKVNQILMLILKGLTRRGEILRYVTEMDKKPKREQRKRHWIPIEKCERTIEDYIKRAREILKEQAISDIKEIKELYIARLDDCYKEAREKGNIQTANSIIKNQIYLQGLGGLNLKGSININNFDVHLTPEEEEAYKKSLSDFYGNDDLTLEDLEEKNENKR